MNEVAYAEADWHVKNPNALNRCLRTERKSLGYVSVRHVTLLAAGINFNVAAVFGSLTRYKHKILVIVHYVQEQAHCLITKPLTLNCRSVD